MASRERFQPSHPGFTPPGDPYLDYGPNLPERYGIDRVFAIARDPETVWAWWEVEGAKTAQLRDVERGVMATQAVSGTLGRRAHEPAMNAFLMPVLHAHLPYVRHPEHDEFLEEDWFFEAITETYVPLIDLMERLLADGVRFRLTMTLTPTLCEMLDDPLL